LLQATSAISLRLEILTALADPEICIASVSTQVKDPIHRVITLLARLVLSVEKPNIDIKQACGMNG